ncbi:MAG: dihydrodipicolinate synthase family protein [Candidatus Sulfopaludibacter sp.]|nr:dihydrodipicolinate synthase family protein [Candidatus Sulfopaludibacter sp.]
MAPICTPFAGDGEVDHAALRRNIAAYCGAGLAGFVVAGSTGEAALLEADEKLKLFATVAGAGAGRTLIAGTAAESVRETLRMIAAAAELGYHAALAITPHYYRAQMLRPETQVGFYRAVAERSALPVLIYDFPQMTGIDLPVEVVLKLSEHPNIIGIKESSADLEKIGRLTASLPAGFQVLVGSSAKFHDCLRLGAIGGILAVANAIPRSTLLIYDRYRGGDVEGSHEAQRRIVEAAGVAPRYGIQGLKYAMDLKGLYGGPARLPLLPLEEGQQAEIELLFRDPSLS